MDTNELKKLLKGSTAVLILENGEPSFVILGYDAYKGLLSDQEKEVKINHAGISNGATKDIRQEVNSTDNIDGNRFQNRIGEKESELLEKINKQILALKSEIGKEERGAGVDQ